MRITVLGLCAITGLFAGCQPSPSNPTIGYIDSTRLMREYHGTQTRRQIIERQAQGWQRSLDSLIAGQPPAPASQGPVVARYRAELQERVLKAGQQADQELLQEVNAYLKEYGQAKGYDFIFGATESGNIVYANQAKNLTADVLRELNQRYDQRHPTAR